MLFFFLSLLTNLNVFVFDLSTHLTFVFLSALFVAVLNWKEVNTLVRGEFAFGQEAILYRRMGISIAAFRSTTSTPLNLDQLAHLVAIGSFSLEIRPDEGIVTLFMFGTKRNGFEKEQFLRAEEVMNQALGECRRVTQGALKSCFSKKMFERITEVKKTETVEKYQQIEDRRQNHSICCHETITFTFWTTQDKKTRKDQISDNGSLVDELSSYRGAYSVKYSEVNLARADQVRMDKQLVLRSFLHLPLPDSESHDTFSGISRMIDCIRDLGRGDGQILIETDEDTSDKEDEKEVGEPTGSGNQFESRVETFNSPFCYGLLKGSQAKSVCTVPPGESIDIRFHHHSEICDHLCRFRPGSVSEDIREQICIDTLHQAFKTISAQPFGQVLEDLTCLKFGTLRDWIEKDDSSEEYGKKICALSIAFEDPAFQRRLTGASREQVIEFLDEEFRFLETLEIGSVKTC